MHNGMNSTKVKLMYGKGTETRSVFILHTTYKTVPELKIGF